MPAAPTLADLLSRAEPGHPAVILPDEGSATTYFALAEQSINPKAVATA